MVSRADGCRIKVKIDVKIKVKIKVKGSGQECPSHMGYLFLRGRSRGQASR